MSNKVNLRDRIVTVRFSDEEYEKVKGDLVASHCESMSEIVRLMVLKRKIKSAPSMVDKETYRVLSGLYRELILFMSVYRGDWDKQSPTHLFGEIFGSLETLGAQLAEKLNDDCKAS